MKYTKSQVRQISQGDSAEIVAVISKLLTHIDQQAQTIERLDTRVRALERQP